MADYIDKNDLREYISGYIKSCNGKPTYTDMDAMVGIISLLEQMPAADVQPIRHGRWTHDMYTQWKCSECGNFLDFDGLNCGRGSAFYCPNCGARMDGERYDD